MQEKQYFWAFLPLFGRLSVEADKKHERREMGYDVQQRSPAELKPGTLQLHGMHCNPDATKGLKEKQVFET